MHFKRYVYFLFFLYIYSITLRDVLKAFNSNKKKSDKSNTLTQLVFFTFFFWKN